jgi:hypothetical protein
MRMTRGSRRVLLVVALLMAVISPTAPANADHNYNCEGAHPIPPGLPWHGTVSSSDLDDWYVHSAFPLPVHVYTLTMTGGDADLYVYDVPGGNCANRRLLCRSTSAGSAADECTAIGGSDHRIQVRYWSGGTVAYRLDVSNNP